MNPLLQLLLYCVAILLASMAGGWLPLVRQLTHIRLQVYLSFASGAMLGAALCHMLPEATVLASGSWFHWTLVGLLGLFFLERFFAFHHHEIARSQTNESSAHVHRETEAHDHAAMHSDEAPRLVWGAALVGLSVHTLMGGFALASAVAAGSAKSGWSGVGVFLATLLHKPADSLTITTLMVTEGASRRSAHRVNFLFALVIPLGVVIYYLVRQLVTLDGGNSFAGGALAFSAGTFLAIALGDLMPELRFHRHDRVKLSAALLAGVAVMYASAVLNT